MRSEDCTAQASTRPFIVSVKRQYFSRPQLWAFFALCSARHTPPPIGHRSRSRVFIVVASAPMRRTSHPSGSRPLDVSLPGQTSAPGIVNAPENPRFPAVSNRVQRTDTWLPRGSTFDRAHCRGVACLDHVVARHLAWVETGTHQRGWLSTNFSPSLQPQPNGWPDLSQRLSSLHRARGLALCNNRPVTAYGPQLSVPRSYCCGSWPPDVGTSAALPAASAWHTAPPP